MIRPDTCPRGKDDCDPLANMIADTDTEDYICVGLNKGYSRKVPQDVYRFCMANEGAPTPGPKISFDADQRDLIDQVAVITHGLSVAANEAEEAK